MLHLLIIPVDCRVNIVYDYSKRKGVKKTEFLGDMSPIYQSQGRRVDSPPTKTKLTLLT